MSKPQSSARNLIDGQWSAQGEAFSVTDKFSGESIGQGWAATAAQVDAAVAAARRSFVEHPLDPNARYTILMKVAELLGENREDLAASIIGESGIPWKDAFNEVGRAMETFRVSAEEAKRLNGDIVPIDGAPDQANRMAYTIRVPRGVVGAITSFNSPLNMVAHKVAPALAAGNTVVFKPPQATPFSATRLFELMLEAGLPPAHANLLQGAGSTVGQMMIEHPGFDFFTFTGSTPVGKKIREARGLGHVALELGSISATIVCADADFKKAAVRVAQSGFRRMGQMCTSTQRLYVERSALGVFLKVGDPWAKDTDVGPMISEKEAARAEAWVAEAVAQGAKVVLGGQRRGAILPPTILSDVTAQMRVMCDEIFAPVLSVVPFDSFDEAVAAVNSVPFGLAAGLFTSNLNRAIEGSRRLHVGVVHINEPSSSRVDLMPFGGVKDSGVGVEGPRYAMREMTEERLVTISL